MNEKFHSAARLAEFVLNAKTRKPEDAKGRNSIFSLWPGGTAPLRSRPPPWNERKKGIVEKQTQLNPSQFDLVRLNPTQSDLKAQAGNQEKAQRGFLATAQKLICAHWP